MTLARSRYDQVPYTSYPYARTHPDRACAIGRLFGMDPAPVTRCRVLELGCASGGNLLPAAELLPGSSFVGVDLSARQIAAGREAIEAVGLRNVELVHGDIARIDESWGSFDYIVCHGVYSWVAAEVQARILAVCRERLRPQGIACISYNTYPGWHLREMVRDVMRWHTRGIDDEPRMLEQARALAEYLAREVADRTDPYATLLNRELDVVLDTSDDYLLHEHLEEHNSPVYFHELVDRIEGHGLRWLAEADLHAMAADTPPSDDPIAVEQVMDFVRNRQFRTSLVVHGEVSPGRELAPVRAMPMRWWLPVTDDDPPVDMTPDAAHGFTTPAGAQIAATGQLTKAAIVVLRESWPRSRAFDELLAAASALCGEAPAAEDLAGDLLRIWLGGGVQGSTWEPPVAIVPGRLPRASGVARWQAAAGFVANVRHQRVDLDGFGRVLVPLLDGTRTVDRLLDELCALAEDGTLVVTCDEETVGAPVGRRQMLAEVLDETLARLVRSGVLLATD